MSTKVKSSIQEALFVYSDFEKAREELVKAISRGPFYGCLTGPSGTGKTSLLREVASSLDRYRHQVHYLAQGQASATGVARFLCEGLRLAPKRFHSQTLASMAQTLKTLPYQVILFVDEANLLRQDSLQEIRLLAESELDSKPLFSALFTGLPNLKEKLEAPALFPLKRRITLRLELNGLKKEEVAPFLAHRLTESEASRFSAEAVSLLFERARGIPAVLEGLSRLCLQRLPGTQPLDVEAITEVLDTWEI